MRATAAPSPSAQRLRWPPAFSLARGSATAVMAMVWLGCAMPAAGAESRSNPAAAPASVKLERDVVAAGLRHPWGMAFLDAATALVTEKDGGLWLVDLGDGRRTEVQGLPDDVANQRLEPRDKSGLFDVALDPQFAVNNRVYIAYAARSGPSASAPTTTKLVAARLERDGTPRLAGVSTMFLARPYSTDRFHYGGGLLVHGNALYLTVGERHYMERDNPPVPVAQDASDSRGKIYRFRLDRPTAPPARVAMGIRAAQGMAAQPGADRIWFTEHGSSGGDELNILRVGANYGWPVRTYGQYREPWTPPPLEVEPYAPPVFYWADRTVAPTGLTFISDRAAAFAEWRGDLLVAGLRRGYLMRIDVEGDRVLAVDYLLEDAPVRLRNVKEGPDGQIYVLTDEPDGKIIRLKRARS